jgi:hypothetical protein
VLCTINAAGFGHVHSSVPSKPEYQGKQKDSKYSKYKRIRAYPEDNGQRTDTSCQQNQNAKQQ